jgi:multiple sugar transport system permease protein
MRKTSSDRPLLFVLPTLTMLTTVAFYPLVSTVWLSLRDELPIFHISRFVGLAHYGALWSDPRFWRSLANTGYFTLVSVSLEILLGLGAALLLQHAFPARGFVRALVLTPWFIPTVVAARLWEWLYNPQFGIVNFLLV